MVTTDTSEDGWRAKLTPEQYRVLRQAGTEAPFSGKYVSKQGEGEYACAACGQVLFHAGDQYESTMPGLIGWPSFAAAADAGAVELRPDDSLGMQRTEVVCSQCHGHLGHLFNDATSPTDQHYCINSICLQFTPEKR